MLFRLRQLTGRFFRNTLIALLVLGGILVAVSYTFRHPLHFLWALPVYWAGAAFLMSYRRTHPFMRLRFRRTTPAMLEIAAEEVSFTSRDGLTLHGHYLPGRNRAALVLVHGLGAGGMSMIYHADALNRHGYGVLIFDLRAHGKSAGDCCSGGPQEAADVLGAVDFLRSRPGVDPRAVGLLGISLGGKTALLAAAADPNVAAVVAEGPTPLNLDDLAGLPQTWRRRLRYPLNLALYWTQRWLRGGDPQPGLIPTLHGLRHRPVLLIAAGTGTEATLITHCRQAAALPAEPWIVDHALHGNAFFFDPERYAFQVAMFCKKAFWDDADPAAPPDPAATPPLPGKTA